MGYIAYLEMVKVREIPSFCPKANFHGIIPPSRRSQFKKNVSCLGKGGNKVAFVECLGVSSSLDSHGNLKYKTSYTRTPVQVMQMM